MINKLMQYPLISEYLVAIRDAHDNLDKLSHLVPVLDNYGEPYRSSGAFAVVFKMKDEQTGKCYALKCFTEEQEGRTVPSPDCRGVRIYRLALYHFREVSGEGTVR